MNMRAWWLDCECDEDVAFYRRHIVKPAATIDWIREQQQMAEEEDLVPRKEINTDILKPLFKHISKLDQQILRMHYAEGMKWREISDRLGYNLSYLWKREKRALEKLRAIIDRDGLSPWRKEDE